VQALAVLSSLVALMRFFDSHGGAHSGPGGRGSCHLEIWWQWPSFLLRNLLLDALMRPGSVEVVHIRVEHALELLLMEDQQMIEALTPHTVWLTNIVNQATS